MIFLTLILILAIPTISLIIGISISAPKYEGPVSDHFDGSRFINSGGVKAKGGGDLFKWLINRNRKPWQEKIDQSTGKRPLDHVKGGIRITFVNHSTFLIQMDGINILTDPIWSNRTSPFRSIGPKRKYAPGIKFGDLPRIHLVLLTHNHYDHLDLQTMRMVFGAHHPKIISPLGIKAFLDQQFITGSTELDWWQKFIFRDTLEIQSVPAQHFSGRGLLDRDVTLWCGFIIKTSIGNIYFAGDTGYNDQTFKEIGKRCGPFRVSLLPIGAYKPEWFMSPIHTSPEESIKIHLDVMSQTSIGMHFGTFALADDGYDEPVEDLQSAMRKYNLNPHEFIILQAGQFQEF
ncbi:MAG: MBL fold metallo-hydrolase [Cyclobacteriaceae bacterium]